MGDVVRTFNFEVWRELQTAPLDLKHYLCTVRCMGCKAEHRALVPVPVWAAGPGVSECDSCHQMLCLAVHPGEEPPEGEEPYRYDVVYPDMRGGVGPPEGYDW